MTAWSIRLVWALLIVIAALVVGAAEAQSTVNQGMPGRQGPWPVSMYLADGGAFTGSGGGGGGGSVTVTFDGGTVTTTPLTCTTSAHKVTSVGVTSTASPATQLANRRYVVLCNSQQNAGIPLVKCRVDGVAPVMAAGNPGDVLAVGDCVTYVIAAATIPQCIADTASTNVLAYECL